MVNDQTGCEKQEQQPKPTNFGEWLDWQRYRQEQIREVGRHVQESALFLIRTSLTLNGGAFIAATALIRNVIGKDDTFDIKPIIIIMVLFLLASGAGFALFAAFAHSQRVKNRHFALDLWFGISPSAYKEKEQTILLRYGIFSSMFSTSIIMSYLFFGVAVSMFTVGLAAAAGVIGGPS